MLTMSSPARRSAAVGLALCLLAALLIFPPAGYADEPPGAAQVADAKARLWADGAPRGVFDVGAGPVFAADALAAPAADGAPNPVSAWSRIAFHSYRDGNAEIYLANGDGTGVRRLTFNEAADLNPRLSPDQSRVVFVSRRDGNYEIYTVGTDGTNLRRLTETNESDLEPAWSPDGKQIIFSSNRTGYWAIYIMAADGSNPRQVTTDHDDGAPAWSPDGNYVAFLRYKDNEGRADIWVMRPDSSDGANLAATERYAQHLTWSPDGARLALDFDSDWDGMNEVNTLLINRRYLTHIYNAFGDPGYAVEPWVGGWSPDSERVIFALAKYKFDYDANQLKLVGGQLAHIAASGHEYTPTFWPETSGLDFGPSWVSADRQPPVTALNVTPTFAPATGFALAWQGSDTGGSGFRSYDVEARVDGGAWQPWATGVMTTTGVYRGVAGQTVDFRVRGRDRAYNVEAWPSAPDATVRLYATTVEGRVRDARGYPVEHASIQAQPESMQKWIVADLEGAYLGYFAVTGTVTLNATHPAYGPVGAATRSGNGPYRADFALPAQTNYVAGGGFDGPALDPAWQAGGDAPPQRVDAPGQFGTGAVALGQPFDLSAPEQVAGECCGWLAARDDTQALLTTPPGSSGPATALDLRWRSGNGAWSAIQRVAIGGVPLYNPSAMAAELDSQRNLHVAWVTGGPPSGLPILYYCVIPHGANACEIKLVTGTENVVSFSLALDGDDVTHVVGNDAGGGGFYARRAADGGWTVEDGESLIEADTATDAQGGLHVVWSHWPQYSNITYTLYRYRSPDGAWGPVETVASGGLQWSFPQVAVTSDGAVHVIWRNYTYTAAESGTYYTSKQPGRTWAPLARASSSIEVAAFGASGGGVELYARLGTGLHRFTLAAGGQWRDMQAWPLDGRTVDQGVLDNRGRAHFVTRVDNTWPQLVYLQSSNLTETPTTSTLRQAVTIPADSHAPTLSFFSRSDATAADRLRVTVADGSGSQPLTLHPTDGEGWSHMWADLSPWAGQTVTLAFEVAAEAGEPAGQVRLDEITLGPWLTPVIDTVTVGEDGRLMIKGANFIAPVSVRFRGESAPVEAADATTLVVALPGNPKPGTALLEVSNPGEVMAKRWARIGKATLLPLLNRW